MKVYFFICLSLFVYAGDIRASAYAGSLPEAGVLDLREIVLDDNTLLNLNGEWEFYWEKLLTPEAHKSGDGMESRILVHVPSFFNNYHIGGKALPGMGYGTYGQAGDG